MLLRRRLASNAASVRDYAARDAHPVTLRKLLQSFTPGVPPSTAALLASARYAHSELPVRLARRIQAFQHLPFIVGTNPYVRDVHDAYIASFETLTSLPAVASLPDNARFTLMLQELTERHAENIPKLARGFLESRPYMASRDVTRFLDDLIRSRIGIRLIAEHHIALHALSEQGASSGGQDTAYVGVVHTRLEPARLLQHVCEYVRDLCEANYGVAPAYVLTGQPDVHFPYVPVHLEYIACELLKNAYRATVESCGGGVSRDALPPVEITVSAGHDDVGIRIRDRGGGIRPDDVDAVFEYSYTTVRDEGVNDDADDADDAGGGSSALSNIFAAQSRLAMQAGVGGPMAGLGYGLPMAQIYARYFGGRLDLVSLDGHGCDVFLRLPSVTRVAETTEI